MARALVFSLVLHLAIGLIAWLDFSLGKPDDAQPLITHNAVKVSLQTLPPKPKPVPKPAPKPKPKVVEKPKPKAAPKPTPKPKPKPAPKPVPKPKPKPKTVPKVEPKPAPKPVVKDVPKVLPKPVVEKAPPVPTQVVKAPPPKRKETPPEDDLNSILIDLSATEPAPPQPKQVASADTDVTDILDDLAAISDDAPESADEVNLTADDFSALRAQLAQCWNIPSGAVAAEDLRVEVRVQSRPDGSVARTSLVDGAGQSSNPYYTIAAESALRALRHPACSTLQLPLEKYELWQDMILTFDPKEMF